MKIEIETDALKSRTDYNKWRNSGILFSDLQ